WAEFKLKYGFDQTPAFILFKNGKVNSMIQWDEKKGLSSDSFHRWLEENRNDIEKLS
ncbi:thioredoxin, partial [Enterococcus mundtii]|nr:thioredoxin [Enterococcus mundtii]